MTPRQADQIIKLNKPVTVHNTNYNETFTVTFIKRDRFNIHTSTGGVFDRSELVIVDPPLAKGDGWVVANV